MNLRPYQQDAINAIESKFQAGVNKQVIVLATGLGKTVIFSKLISDRKSKGKALILAHREELLTQAKDKLLSTDPTLDVSIEQGQNWADLNHDVIIASVATLGRTASERIKRFDPKLFSTIVIDEAHHSSASTYRNVLEHFGVLKDVADWNKDCLLLGVTATPQRMDNEGIDKIFDEVTYNFDILKGMQDKWLVPIHAYRVNTTTDISSVSKTAGDFNLGELGDAINNKERNALVVKTYKDRTPGKQALVFAVDVAHTQELCTEFESEGIASSYIIGTTPKEERAQRVQDFADRKVQVMVNCMTLTEGFDSPGIETVFMARPTQSGILFQQMLGRGTRLHPNKTHLTAIDFVDNTYRQRLKTTASLLGIDGAFDFKGRDIFTVRKEIEQLQELSPKINWDDLNVDNIKYSLEQVDLLSGLAVPDEMEKFTKFDWHRYTEDSYRLNLGGEDKKRYVHLSADVAGNYSAVVVEYDPVAKTETPLVNSATYKSLEDCVRKADAFVKAKYGQSLALIDLKSRWRKLPPSEAQLNLLRNMRVNEEVIQLLDKGQASRLITKLMERKKR